MSCRASGGEGKTDHGKRKAGHGTGSRAAALTPGSCKARRRLTEFGRRNQRADCVSSARARAESARKEPVADMKAIRVHEFGDSQVMKLEEVPDPRPGPGQVVIKVQGIGVNPVEGYIRSGKYAAKPTLPYTPGSDCGGTIESIGEGVTIYKAGDRVYTSGAVSGAYAERA